MPTKLASSLDDLRNALLDLPATGENGFEGLLAVVLSKITQQPFRLASSGLQLGLDGETLPGSSHIAFEAKLYSEKINKNDVHSKMTSIIGGAAVHDLWILGITIEANTQLLTPLETAANRNGIATLILDWPNAAAIPPLAAACAMATEQVGTFLADHIADKALAEQANVALKKIAEADEFITASDEIRRSLHPASIGMPIALEANAKWLNESFADADQAHMVLGQRLAPRATWPVPVRIRQTLIEKLQARISSAPSGKIIAVLGGEGVGKSWLLAQSWCETAKPVLTIIIPAVEIREEHFTRFDDLIISKLIEQTGDSPTDDQTQRRWQRRLKRWRELPPAEHPYFAVCIDGLNQHSSFDWPRWLGGAASKLAKVGASLVVTDRAAHFDGRIRNAIATPVERLVVPEWTLDELDSILREKSIDPKALGDDVRRGLRNPRVLGIAFELYQRGNVQSFDELSVARLMFEHIRLGARDGSGPREQPLEFVRRLAEHAKEILGRVKSQAQEDRLIFESAGGKRFELKPELLSVTAERFFRELKEDPTRYTLSNEGLSFALGLAIIDALIVAERNDPSKLSDVLSTLLEPISALDKTAEAVFNAVLVSSVDERCSDRICSALFAGYVQLQNVDDETFAAFSASVRFRPDAAMQSLEAVVNGVGRAARPKWLITALRQAREDKAAWLAMAPRLHRWIAGYSLAPELGAFYRSADEADKYAAELASAAQNLKEIDGSLTNDERSFRADAMHREDGSDPSVLSNAAFQILAGAPLADFAGAFVGYALSRSLNSRTGSMPDQFLALVRFNIHDWSETRSAILAASKFLSKDSASRTGKWAFVTLLRATATEEDAARETALVAKLTEDREHHPGWRRVEDYCASDPCDPSSEEPDNIQSTANQFQDLDPALLSSHEAMTQDDRFFKDALPGLVRFRPDTAIATIQRYANDALSREGRSLLFCVTSLEPHSAALNEKNIQSLLQVSRDHAASPREEEGLNEEWVSSQYALLAAFPHIDGKMQISSLPAHHVPMLKLVDNLKSAPLEDIEKGIEEAISSGSANQKLAALAFAHQHDYALGASVRDAVARLAFDEKSSVRGEAMALIVKLGDAELVKKVVDGGWSASPLEGRKKGFEIWHGSKLIILAAKLGLIEGGEALDRISAEMLGLAASELGGSVHAQIGARLRAALKRAVDIEITRQTPLVEREIRSRRSTYPSFLSLAHEEADDDGSIPSVMRRMNETPEDFAKRQSAGWEAFFLFERELTEKQARIIIDDVDSAAIAAAISSSTDWGREMADVILQTSESQLYRAYNFALKLAQELSDSEPTLSRQLFEQIQGGRGSVSIIYKPSGVSLEALCAWGGADNSAWNELRIARLDAASSDDELASEVLAATMAGRSMLLERYAAEKLARPEPASVSRALMTLGFGGPSEFADATIARYAEVDGFIGRAANQARYAYNRNVWSMHWYDLMGQANAGEEFWRWSVLFRKIVDGRVSLWQRELGRDGGPSALFEPLLDGEIERRIADWKKKREKHLFGETAPARVYLERPWGGAGSRQAGM